MSRADHRGELHQCLRYLGGGLISGLVTVGLIACENPDKIFEGVWESVIPVEASAFISGRPELAIGHFGQELTGVVRFLDDNGLEVDGCTCAFLDQLRLDLDAERLAVTSECGDQVLVWEFERTNPKNQDDVFLDGHVTPAEGGPSTRLKLRQVADFVVEERRECRP